MCQVVCIILVKLLLVKTQLVLIFTQLARLCYLLFFNNIIIGAVSQTSLCGSFRCSLLVQQKQCEATQPLAFVATSPLMLIWYVCVCLMEKKGGNFHCEAFIGT